MTLSSRSQFSKQGEVSLLSEFPAHTNSPKSHQQLRFYIVLLCMIIFPTVGTCHQRLTAPSLSPRSIQPRTSPTFAWTDILPSHQLNYTPCYDGFQCARLDVPLNWNGTSNSSAVGPRAAIAVIKLPARVPVTDDRYGGPILMNPGGPGYSGIYQVLSGGRAVQTIVDSSISPTDNSTANHTESGERGKYFDIIGFDPRGVNNTTPHVKCFPNVLPQEMWARQYVYGGLEIRDSNNTFESSWARAQALSQSCSQDRDGIIMARYVSTAQVVQDMVEIIEQHGIWRENEAKRLLAKDKRGTKEEDTAPLARRQQNWSHKPGKEPLQYWGFSYGTVLGATFAAMHPSRSHRVILDGVINTTDYYATSWLHNLLETDQIVTKFTEYCFAAGPKKCPLAISPNITSAKDIESQLNNLVARVKMSPIVVPASDTRGPEIITSMDLLYTAMASGINQPYRYVDTVFALVADLIYSNGSVFADFKQALYSSPSSVTLPSQTCLKDGPFSDSCYPPELYELEQGTTTSTILCLDGASRRNESKADYKEYIEELNQQSHWLGDVWSSIRIQCTGFTVKTAWTFDWFSFLKRNTSTMKTDDNAPILFISNNLDPVAPKQDSFYMAEIFSAANSSGTYSSSILLQDTEGHCSYSQPSLCTAKAVRAYFQSGEVPKPGTLCLPVERPFLGPIGNDTAQGDDAEVIQALKLLASVWPEP